MNIIPVHQLLVKPSRVFFRLDSSEDLSPFMFELPRIFGSHETFLKGIGVKETPNSNDYCLFLTDLQVECRNGRLNPNELKAVLTITHAIADQQQQQQQTEPINTTSLCLPDESGVLRKISNCLLCDDLWLKSRCAHRLEEYQLYVLHPFVPNEDAVQLGARKLSQVVSETLGGQQLMNKTALDVTSSSITSSKFLVSLSALLLNRQHDQHTTATNGSNDGINYINDQFSVQYLLSKLSALSVSQVDSITVLFQLSVNSSEAVSIGEEERLSFVNNNKEILISRTLLSPSITVTLAVSSALCKFLGIETYLAGTIACLIAQSEEHSNSNNNMDGIKLLQLGNDGVLMNEKLRGVPGNPVQEIDLPYIENKPFRIFRIGEIVAFLADDGQGAMTYGKVLLVGNAIDAGLRKIKLSTTPDNSSSIDLLSTDVYSFKSAREMSSHSSQTLDSSSPTRFTETALNVLTDHGESQTSATTGSATSALTSSFVSRSDLMNTLNGLLHRLNIPTDMQDGSLMDRIITMNETNAKLEEQLRQEVQLGMEAREQMNRMTAAMKCQICITEDVTHVMAPCGHTICLTCLQRLQRNKCPFCRTNINLKVKFFTSDETS